MWRNARQRGLRQDMRIHILLLFSIGFLVVSSHCSSPSLLYRRLSSCFLVWTIALLDFRSYKNWLPASINKLITDLGSFSLMSSFCCIISLWYIIPLWVALVSPLTDRIDLINIQKPLLKPTTLMKLNFAFIIFSFITTVADSVLRAALRRKQYPVAEYMLAGFTAIVACAFLVPPSFSSSFFLHLHLLHQDVCFYSLGIRLQALSNAKA